MMQTTIELNHPVLIPQVSRFRYYREDQLAISSIDSKLTAAEKTVRRYLMNHIIDHHTGCGPLVLAQAAESLNMPLDRIQAITSGLLEKNALAADDEGTINFIYPVSALPTKNQVRLADGREFFAMCAIDAMGTAFTFHQDVEIRSECSQTEQPISLSIKDGQLIHHTPADLHALHVDLNKNTNWSGSC